MKNKRVWIVLAVILLIVALVLFLVLRKEAQENNYVMPEGEWNDPVLDTAEYEAVFATMDGDFYFSEQEFLEYRGLQVVKASQKVETLAHIGGLTREVNEKNGGLNTVYLQINPMLLYQNLGEEVPWQDALEYYLTLPIQESPNVTYEILLSYPRLSYLATLSEEEWELYKQVYLDFMVAVGGMENVFVYYLGNQEWLSRNPLNYENDFMVNRDVEKHIILSVFCDRKYIVTPSQMHILLAEMDELLGFYKVDKCADLSDWSFVFLGDSIIGNDRTTCSVPSVVSAFSGADVYNCGKNGAAATYDKEAEVSFGDVTQAIISGNTEAIVNPELADSINEFRKSYDTENLCFVLNYGLNDYFMGYPTENAEDSLCIETYAGALRTGIGQLKQAYPDAEIIVMLPTYTILYEEGTQIMSSAGAQLTDYRNVAQAVAEEMGVFYKDNYEDIPLDINTHTTLLADGTHLNEQGRYVLGSQIVTFFEKEVLEKTNR